MAALRPHSIEQHFKEFNWGRAQNGERHQNRLIRDQKKQFIRDQKKACEDLQMLYLGSKSTGLPGPPGSRACWRCYK